MQDLFDPETKETANKDFDTIHFSQTQSDVFRVERKKATIPGSPSHRARLFAIPTDDQAEKQDHEDEIARILKKLIMKVRYINLGYLLLSLVIVFYRIDLLDVTMNYLNILIKIFLTTSRSLLELRSMQGLKHTKSTSTMLK